ncbi:MAG: beta-galactosidase [Armatimonadota bacterium]
MRGTVAVKRGDEVLARLDFAPAPPTTAWRPGEPHEIGPLELPVSKYVSSGDARIEFRLYRTAFGKDGDAIVRALTIEGREGRLRPTRAVVKPYRGAPCLFVGRRSVYPLLYLQGRKPVPEHYRHVADQGYELFSCGLPLGWVGPGKYDYSETDATMIALLNGVEDGYVIPRVSVSAPGWWCDAHEEELTRYADGVGWVSDHWGGTKHQSFASELWRKDAGEALRRLIRHIRASPYADRVIGYHVASGIYGEWHLWSPEHLPDTSEPMRERFVRWCRDKYGTVERLNAAWGTRLRRFEDVTCPTKEERCEADLGVFRDLSKSTRVPDYWRCLHETTADAIGHFCRIVKEETDGKALAGAFYCYITDIGWPQEGGHLAVAKALADPNVDFIANPHSYVRRALGQDGGCRSYPASVALHGKLFIDEGDDRTYVVRDAWTHVKTAEETTQILRRAAVNAVAARHGMWWFDMTTGWYEDARLLETLGRLKAMADRTLQRERPRPTEVAVVCDPESFYVMRDWQTRQDRVTPELFTSGFAHLFTMGAPFDVLILDDLMRADAPDYRCYVFLNTYHVDEAERAELSRRLHRGGKCLVFTYCPAFSSERGLDVAHAEELLGLDLALRREPAPMRVTVTEDGARLMGVKAGFGWGPEEKQAPSLEVSDSEATVLARYADGSPAVAFKEQGDWSVVFTGTGPAPRELLRLALRRAGVHVYLDTPDNLYVGANLVALHTTTAGEKVVRLPGEFAVRDALTGRLVSDRSRRIEMGLDAKVTAIWELLPPR